MNKVTILQPTFLAWPGYFRIIYESDIVVFLDDAQFSKNSWHSRNYIISNFKKKLITLPLLKTRLDTPINKKIILNNSKTFKSIIKTIEQAYANSKYYKDIEKFIQFFQNNNLNYLADKNISIIKYFCDNMNFNKQFCLSSSLNLEDKRTDKVIKILNYFNATEYISPAGSEGYMLKDRYNQKTAIPVKFINFQMKSYNQFSSRNFIPYLSIIDLLANLGWKNSKNYIMADTDG